MTYRLNGATSSHPTVIAMLGALPEPVCIDLNQPRMNPAQIQALRMCSGCKRVTVATFLGRGEGKIAGLEGVHEARLMALPNGCFFVDERGAPHGRLHIKPVKGLNNFE